MQKNILISLGLILGLGRTVQAQNLDDLTRYSGQFIQGTARSAAVGNAFGAVGADFGSLEINPAGLGLYRTPEFSLTAGFNQTATTGDYLGTKTGDNAFNFNISNLGFVTAHPRMRNGAEVTEGWVSVNWAIGFNRTNNFWSNTVIDGRNTNNSIINGFADNATNQVVKPADLSAGSYGYLGYWTYLVDPSPADSTIYVDATRFDNKINVHQRDIIANSGATNDISMSFGGNYSNRFYLGGIINIPVLNFSSVRTFTETNLNPIDNSIGNQYHSSTLTEKLNTTGVGISAGIGAIYRFSNKFRAGAAIQLPTVYSLKDDFSTSLEGVTRDTTVSYTVSDGGSGYDYTMITPAKITISGAFFFNKDGFLSADYQYSDYANATVQSKDYDFFALNQSARQLLTGVHNIRIGGEYKIKPFALRAGYNYVSSPYRADQNSTLKGFDGKFGIFSLGAGFRDHGTSVDLTWQMLNTSSTYTPYVLNSGKAESAGIISSRSNLMLSVISRF